MPIRFICSAVAAGLFSAALAASADDPLPAGVMASFKGHTESIYAVTFTPDGKYLVSGSFDKTLKLWELPSGKEVRAFGGQAGHQNLVLSAALSADGRILASGGSDNSAKLWDMPVNVAARVFDVGGVHAVALSTDGTKLAGAGKDGNVKVWNTADGKLLLNLTGHAGPAQAVAFSSNNQLLASGGADGTVRLWNAGNGQLAGVIEAHDRAVHAVAFHANNQTVYSASEDGTWKAWQLPVVAPRRAPDHGGAVSAVVALPGKNLLLTAGADKGVRVVNFANGQQVRMLPGPTAAVTALAVAVPNGPLTVATTADGKIYFWNLDDGKLLGEVPSSGSVQAVAAHGTHGVITGGADGQLKLWPVKLADKPAETKPLKQWAGHAGGVTAVAYHGRDNQVLTGGSDKMVKLWDVAAAKPLRTYATFDAPVRAVAFSPNLAFVTAAAGKVVKLWQADGKEIGTFSHPTAVTSLALSEDNAYLVTGAEDNRARVWNVQTPNSPVLQSFRQAGPVRAVALLNKQIITGVEKTVAIQALSLIKAIPAAGEPIRALSLVGEGTQFVTASGTGVTRWNLGGADAPRLEQPGPVTAFAVARNNALLAVAAGDKMIRLYPSDKAFTPGTAPMATLNLPAAASALAFSPNSQTLTATCDDGAVRSWKVVFNPGQPLPADFGKPLQAFTHADSAAGIVYAPDSNSFYTAAADKTVKAWKFATDAPTKNFGHANLVDAVAFNRDGTLLATGSHDGTVRIWDVAKGQQLRQINAHTTPAPPSPVYCVAWTPDGKQVVSGSLDRTLKLWDAGSGNLVREFKAYKEKEFEKGHRDGVFCCAFSPDGKLLVSGSSDRTLKIWNVADGGVARECVNPNLKSTEPPMTGPLSNPPAAHPGWVYSLRLTPNGKYIVSAGTAPRNKGYLALWDVADGKMLYGEELALGPIYAVAMSPDGKTLALGCGPRGRQAQEVPCYLFKMPDAGTR